MAIVEQLSSKYSSQLSQLQAIFPSWDQGDLAYTLQDAKGSLDEAAMMITEGRAAQFTQATRKKPVKSDKEAPQGRGHSNRNADSGGWENVNGGEGTETRGGRGGRGGRGSRGGRGGRGGEPFRGARGGRGGGRGGRGGFIDANGNSSKKPDAFLGSAATTTEGWASQVEQATTADGEDAGWASTVAEPDTNKADTEGLGETVINGVITDPSKGDDFSAAGGWGDAPAAKELEKAAKTGGMGWQEEIKKPVAVAKPSAAIRPMMTWAQIAKPQEKPKYAPPPAPPVQADPEHITTVEPTVDDTEVPPEMLEENPSGPVGAWGDAPTNEELEAEATRLPEQQERYANGDAEEFLPEEPPVDQVSADTWQHDPAIAGSGTQPDWAIPQPPSAPLAPEPITTYTGPPGFNTVAAKAAAAAAQPRTSSRAGRYKNIDGQGVVLPAMASGMSSMEMQFGSLSFGGQGGDGIEALQPETQPSQAPVQPARSPLQAVTSPVRQAQPPVPASAVQNPSASIAPVPSQAATHPFYTQQPAQSQLPPQSQQQYSSPQQTLQQQMAQYQSHYLQQQTQEAQAPSQSQYYRGQQDYYGAQQQQQPPPQAASQGQAAQQQQQQSQQQQSQAQPQTSPYEAGYGGSGGSQLYGQQPQQSQHSAQTNEAYGAAQRAYDSYTASGYPRPAMDESKPAAPVPTSHTPTAPAQSQQGVPQSQYYSQLNNMGYYQAAPYNPYYQYGQAPQPGFQQYYPLAGRNHYGQPTPQAPAAAIPQASKPSPAPAHSPYGGHQSYPSSAYDDQSSLSMGRYGESKPQQQAQAQPQPSFQSQQGLQNFLGMNTPSASSASSRHQAGTPDDSFKTAQSGSAASRPQPAAQGQANQPQSAQHQQGGFGNYPGYGAYQSQDWSQYGQHYGGSRNGYSQWQQ